MFCIFARRAAALEASPNVPTVIYQKSTRFKHGWSIEFLPTDSFPLH
jgi:hypothetical protein